MAFNEFNVRIDNATETLIMVKLMQNGCQVAALCWRRCYAQHSTAQRGTTPKRFFFVRSISINCANIGCCSCVCVYLELFLYLYGMHIKKHKQFSLFFAAFSYTHTNSRNIPFNCASLCTSLRRIFAIIATDCALIANFVWMIIFS